MMIISEPKKRMLVIDDDKSILRVLKKILEKNGYEVDTAETGKEAEEKLGSNSYDATLIDLRLPDTVGTELLPFMQSASPQMVKIILTGSPSARHNIGNCVCADAFLVKPVHPQILIDILRRELRKKGFPA